MVIYINEGLLKKYLDICYFEVLCMKAYYLQYVQEVKSGHNKSIGLGERGAVVDKRRWTKLGCADSML